MNKLRRSILTAVLVALALAPIAHADDITAGFKPHVRPTTGGRIDWTDGYLLADGEGYAEGTSNQQKLMARRAAELDAAANALAAASGINVDAGGRAGGLRDGRRRLEGVIKGHQVAAESWSPNAPRPTYRLTLRVPLWGVKSIASTFHFECRRRLARTRTTQLSLVAEKADTSNALLIIDARGTDLQPCLFPEIVTDQGKTLLSINTLPVDVSSRQPIVRYVESSTSFEKLQAACGRAAKPTFLLAAAPPPEEKSEAKTQKAKDKEKPAADEVKEDVNSNGPSGDNEKASKKKTRRRRRDRRAFKAIKTSGRNKSKIVVTADDAEKLRHDKTNAALLRKAEIVVIVDSPAAGVQGRRNGPPAEILLALADCP